MLFFNSTGLFRQGDETNGMVKFWPLQLRLKTQYGESAAEIIRVCQPVMKARNKERIQQKKNYDSIEVNSKNNKLKICLETIGPIYSSGFI